MKHLILGAVFILAGAGIAAADPVFGTWKTAPDDNGNFGYVKVASCGSEICGTLVKAFDPQGTAVASDNIGKKIIWGMVAEGDGAYGNGKVWAPDRDKTYNSKMTLSGNSLTIKGCVMMICRDGGIWTRVN